MRRFLIASFLAPILIGSLARACSICGPGAFRTAKTLREETQSARLVLFGTLVNPRLGGTGSGQTDLNVETIVKNDPGLANRKTVTLSRYIPVDAKSPPKFLVFCDIISGEIDAYRGSPIKSPAVVEYLKGAAALPQDRTGQLVYFFKHLDSDDPEISGDAFSEFAKASDADVATAAKKLDAAKFRKLLSNSETPIERLGLYAYLLGACGGTDDSKVLTRILNDSTERNRPAFGGALAGLIQLQPPTGWALTRNILADPKRSFSDRMAALKMLQFFHTSQPDFSRAEIVKGLAGVLPQNDLADLAIETLRSWQCWDLTAEIVALSAKKSHQAPIMKFAIVRYALCCPKPEAKQLVEKMRAAEPQLVKDVEEGLRYEKQPIGE